MPRERFREVWAQLLVVGDVKARVERLVREAAVGVAGVGVGAVRVGEQAHAVVEERPPAGVVLAVFGEAPVACVHSEEHDEMDSGVDSIDAAWRSGEC